MISKGARVAEWQTAFLKRELAKERDFILSQKREIESYSDEVHKY